jgi:predicted dinucleotide-binding enzyme
MAGTRITTNPPHDIVRIFWKDTKNMTTVGVIGSGQIGSTIARLAMEAGHQVVLSNSRGPETLAGTVAELGPRASAATSVEAAAAGDIVVVSVPVKAFPDFARRATGRQHSHRHMQLRPRA